MKKAAIRFGEYVDEYMRARVKYDIGCSQISA